MPCGGIYPGGLMAQRYSCLQCDKPGCDLWCEEWDSPLHSECVEEFLKTVPGDIVLNHGHEVIIHGPDGAVKILHERRYEAGQNAG